MRKVGRPSRGISKRLTRTITTDPETESFLRDNPQYNASELYRTFIHSLMPKDNLELRINDLDKEIIDLKGQLSVKEMELTRLKRTLEERKRLRIDQRIEEEMGAWYMRSLYVQGIFSPPKRLPLEKLISKQVEDGYWGKEELIFKNGSWQFTEHTSMNCKVHITALYRTDGNRILDLPKSLNLDFKDLSQRYMLEIKEDKYREFEDDVILCRAPQGEMPLDYFMKFKPKVNSERTRNELRKKMEQEYMSMTIEVTQ
jgi:hypothetical protein